MVNTKAEFGLRKCRSWSDDPMAWVVVGVVTGVVTSVATVLISRAFNLQIAQLKAKLAEAEMRSASIKE